MPEYNGHEYEVERRENSGGGYAYEFFLFVDGQRVTTASELEDKGHRGPQQGGDNWTSQLRRYAGAYIDGIESDR